MLDFMPEHQIISFDSLTHRHSVTVAPWDRVRGPAATLL